MHDASLAGFWWTTNELLKAGADVNCKGSEKITPLHDAVKGGHYKVMLLYLKIRCNLSSTKSHKESHCFSFLKVQMLLFWGAAAVEAAYHEKPCDKDQEAEIKIGKTKI